jgi:hypothetical protein
VRIRETAPGAVPVLPPFLLEPRFALRLSVSRQLWVSDLYSELRNHAISPIPAPRLATTTTESFNLRLPLGGCRRGQGPTNPIRWVRSTTQKKQLNDTSQLRIGEEWRLPVVASPTSAPHLFRGWLPEFSEKILCVLCFLAVGCHCDALREQGFRYSLLAA